MHDDLITVILPTYNMSAALRLAIESALMQTHRNFELLVVGDGCTDDSEAVVRGFADPRVHWFNLPENAGSQYAPNNFGLRRARGEVVAYLGHDDVWAPAHLARGLAALHAHAADIVTNVAIIHGPPESGFRGAMGLFPDGEYSPRFHFPPPAMLHRRDLVDRVGFWRPPKEAEIGTDYDFVIRCFRAGAKIVSTRAPTVLKFNTGWRRDAYRKRDTTEQEQAIAALRSDPAGYIESQLVALAQCAIEDRLIRIEASGDPAERAGLDTARDVASWLTFKGVTRRDPARLPRLGTEPVRFRLEEEYSGLEWHPTEQHPHHGPYRWSGPSTVSTIPLPVRLAGPTEMTMQVVYALDPGPLRDLAVTFEGRPVEITTVATEDGGWRVTAVLVPQPGDDDPRIAIVVPRTFRPFDVLGTADRRWLGLAIAWIELRAV